MTLPFDDELLTAVLDGEATPTEEAEVARRVAEDPDVARRLEGLRQVRGMLRGLDLVEPPPGALDRIVATVAADADQIGVDTVGTDDRRGAVAGGAEVVPIAAGRRARRTGIAAAAAAVALIGVGAAVAPPAAAMVPPIDDYVERHEMVAAPAATPAGPMPLAMHDVQPSAVEGMGGLSAMPQLAGMPRDHVFDGSDGTHVFYKDATHEVSVYAVGGAVAWGSLPAGGTMEMVGDVKVWTRHDGPNAVMVAERGREVYTLVGDAPDEYFQDAVAALPDAPMTMADRMRAMVDTLTAPFSL